MKEVEILVEVLDKKESALKKLEKFEFMGVKETLDLYFFDPKRSELKPEKGGRLNACFRLRKKDKKAQMTYKIDNFDKNGKWIYSDEDEVEVSDLRIAENIIEHLGLKKLVEIDNKKWTYLTSDLEIVFEEVKDLGLFLEVEKLNVKDDADINVIKKEIWNFIKSLKIKIGEELNAGKPELMMKKKMIYKNLL